MGLRCPKLVWCAFNNPEMIPPADADTQARFDQGHEVGDWSKKRYPDGVEVEFEKGFEHTLTRTKELVSAKKTIFEASFKHKNTYCRVDILIPCGDCWDLIEVKQTTQVKDEHIEDVAFQRYCLEGAGLHIRRCHLMHINNEYVRQRAIDPESLLTIEDISEDVEEAMELVEENIADMLNVINSKEMPDPEFGTECIDPKNCEVCGPTIPKDSVFELDRFGKKAMDLINNGVTLIKDLPGTVRLSDKQKIQVYCLKTGKPHLEEAEIRRFLKGLKYPLHMLDFETVNPAIPLFDGTRPYQNIPFQMSLHIIEKSGSKAQHFEFLAEDERDPRPAMIEALHSIKPEGTVLAYNMSFERSVIEALLEMKPSEKWLHSIIDRLDDLIIPFRNYWYYHPAQHGSASIKKVLPALTGRSYDDLEVKHGSQASREFLEMNYKTGDKPKKSAAEREKLRRALLEYCKQDTEAMIDVLEVLQKSVGM